MILIPTFSFFTIIILVTLSLIYHHRLCTQLLNYCNSEDGHCIIVICKETDRLNRVSGDCAYQFVTLKTLLDGHSVSDKCTSDLTTSGRISWGRQTIRGVQIRAGEVYIYMYVWRYVCRMPRIRNVGGVRPLPFFVCASRSNVVTNGNGTGTNNV